MNEKYRDEARVEHMNRAIQKVQKLLTKVNAVGKFAETIQPIRTLPPNVADFD